MSALALQRQQQLDGQAAAQVILRIGASGFDAEGTCGVARFAADKAQSRRDFAAIEQTCAGLLTFAQLADLALADLPAEQDRVQIQQYRAESAALHEAPHFQLQTLDHAIKRRLDACVGQLQLAAAEVGSGGVEA